MTPLERPWHVAVTRDEPPRGPLSAALAELGLTAVACPVLIEAPPSQPARLVEATQRLGDYHWIIVASRRSVQALRRHGLHTWPRGLRSAAVGSSSAGTLRELGADPAPVTGADDGAESLMRALREQAPWHGTRVLVTTTPGGRTVIQEELRMLGALVDDVEAYRMVPRAPSDIAIDWWSEPLDAAVIASPRVAITLVEAIGREALANLSCVVAIGGTTAAALMSLGVTCRTAETADFRAAARLVADARRAAPESS